MINLYVVSIIIAVIYLIIIFIMFKIGQFPFKPFEHSGLTGGKTLPIKKVTKISATEITARKAAAAKAMAQNVAFYKSNNISLPDGQTVLGSQT
jgi:hypothetical protein